MSITAPGDGATLMIVDIARLLRRRFETALASVDTGLTVAEARALACVWRNPGLRQAAIAERMNVEPMTLVGYLDALEKAGLVKRETDPNDRRAKLVKVTDAANPVLQRIETAIVTVRSDALGDLTDGEYDALEATLAKMRTALCKNTKTLMEPDL